MAGHPLVTGADAAARSPSALRIVLAAERLFAVHGIDGVSLRQISIEAGSSNNSAVHYYFGSKEGLIAAIFRHRLPQLLSERRLLAARCDPDDLRSRFEAHYLPVLNLAEATDNHYVSFVEQLQRRALATGAATPGFADLPDAGQRSHDEFRRDLERLLAHLDEPARWMRISEAELLCLHAAADRERAVASGAAIPTFELFVTCLLDGITGFLTAPVSEATRSRLGHAPDTTDPRSAGRLRLL
jgi:AcrR family transcriptional regulator